MRTLMFLLGLLVCGIVTSRAEAAMSQLEVRLQGKVREYFSQLTDLEPWQRRLFSEEVLPQYQRYIKNYQEGAGKLDAEVDLEKIRRSIAFYGPSFFGVLDPKVLSWVVAKPGCDKCTGAASNVMQTWKLRTQRRNLAALWMKSADIQVDPEADEDTPEQAWEQRLLDQARKVGAQAVMLIVLTPNPDHDGDHLMKLVFRTTAEKKPIRKTANIELMGADSFEDVFGRAVSDVFQDLGAPDVKTAVAAASDSAGQDGFRVEITGIKQFDQLQKAKRYLQGVAGPGGICVERKMARGHVLFVIQSVIPANQLEQKILAGSKKSEMGIRMDKTKLMGNFDPHLHLEVL